jgi:hypothetical protein
MTMLIINKSNDIIMTTVLMNICKYVWVKKLHEKNIVEQRKMLRIMANICRNVFNFYHEKKYPR